MVTTIRRYLAPALVGLEAEDEGAVRRAMEREIAPSVHTGQPIAKSAVEMALCDLLSRAAGKGLAEYLRDWLEASGWNKEPPAPHLPDEVVEQTRRRYIEAYERITGRRFTPAADAGRDERRGQE